MRTSVRGSNVTLALAMSAVIAGSAGAQTAPARHDTRAERRESSGDKPYVVPRTSWGDPDLSGTLTNVFEASTPFERPDAFAGRKINEITREEVIKYRASLEERTLKEFEGPLHGPDHWWQTIYDLKKGSQAWFVLDPEDGKIPALTRDGEARLKSAQRVRGSYAENSSWKGPEDFTLYDRCITRGLPGSMMPAIYGNSYDIVQAPGFVAIRYEMIHETRIIPLDGGSHVGKGIALDMGDARGHWDGDTLVVETTNFTERSAYRNANPQRLRLVERFTRVAPDRITWTVMVDDPTTWTRPWTFGMPLTMTTSEAVMPYECHEGNYGLVNMLKIAREHDAAAGKDGAAK
jgi:hypothetical protein